jgi:MFS family permease
LFFLSYLTNHLGEWFTFLASIAALESFYPPSSAKTSVSVLIAVRLLPFVLFLPFGGVLADGRDKRTSMVVLDLSGAVIALLFVMAVREESAPFLYCCTFLQECVSALYEPSRSSIVPLLARGGSNNDDDELIKATYLTGMAWSFMAAFGSSLGGFFVSLWGIQACYCVDSATYLLSAALLKCMGGTWDASVTRTPNDEDDAAESPWQFVRGMVEDGVTYLRSSFFGMLVLVKPSMELVWGAGDILNVAFSERYGQEQESAARLGLLFASAGVGCILGPLLTDRYARLDAPTSVQRLCLLGMALVSIGCFCMGAWSMRFATIGAFTAIRAMGSSIVWVNSALLLQKFSMPEMLGRVTSMELAVTLLANMVAALAAGALVDRAGWTAEQLSFGLSVLGALLFSCWAFYHVQGKGAGAYKLQNKESNAMNSTTTPRSTHMVNELTPLVQV